MNLPLRALNVVDSVVRWAVWTGALLMPAVALSFAWADEPEKATPSDPRHDMYRDDAERCSFLTAGGDPLTLVKEPILRWSTGSSEDDWSGDIFVWMHEKRPEVIGCMMSGPTSDTLRKVVHEFTCWARRRSRQPSCRTGSGGKPRKG